MSDAPENLRYAGRVHLHVVALTTVLAVELCRAGGYPVRITIVHRAIFTGFGIRSALAGNLWSALAAAGNSYLYRYRLNFLVRSVVGTLRVESKGL